MRASSPVFDVAVSVSGARSVNMQDHPLTFLVARLNLKGDARLETSRDNDRHNMLLCASGVGRRQVSPRALARGRLRCVETEGSRLARSTPGCREWSRVGPLWMPSMCQWCDYFVLDDPADRRRPPWRFGSPLWPRATILRFVPIPTASLARLAGGRQGMPVEVCRAFRTEAMVCPRRAAGRAQCVHFLPHPWCSLVSVV